MKKWWLLAVMAAAHVAAAFLLGEIAFHPPRRPLSMAAAPSTAGLWETAAIQASDGVLLRAWYYEPRAPNGDAVLLLHGVADNRTGVRGIAELCLRHGYRVLLPDMRAHGESGGDIATYGLWEVSDIRQWVNWLEEHHRPRRLFGLGESMGAAILLQSLVREPRFCAAVAESPFSSFREVAYDRVGQPFGLGDWFGRWLGRSFVEAAFLYGRFRYGVALDQAAPLTALQQVRIPVLLIHGTADRNIPIRHSHQLAALKLSNVTLWEVPNARHTAASATQPGEFEKRTMSLFASGCVPEKH